MYRFTRIVLNNYRRFGSFKNQLNFTPKFPKVEQPIKLILGASFLSFLEKKDEDLQKQETDLVMAIKRGEIFNVNHQYKQLHVLVYARLF